MNKIFVVVHAFLKLNFFYAFHIGVNILRTLLCKFLLLYISTFEITLCNTRSRCNYCALGEEGLIN